MRNIIDIFAFTTALWLPTQIFHTKYCLLKVFEVGHLKFSFFWKNFFFNFFPILQFVCLKYVKERTKHFFYKTECPPLELKVWINFKDGLQKILQKNILRLVISASALQTEKYKFFNVRRHVYTILKESLCGDDAISCPSWIIHCENQKNPQKEIFIYWPKKLVNISSLTCVPIFMQN